MASRRSTSPRVEAVEGQSAGAALGAAPDLPERRTGEDRRKQNRRRSTSGGGSSVRVDTRKIVGLINMVIGVVVDAVSDVVDFAADEVRPPPDLGATVAAEYPPGMATCEGRVIVMLDIAQLFNTWELEVPGGLTV